MENLLVELVKLNFGEWLIVRRHQLDLSQADLAEALGVSRQTIGNWESGRSIATFTIAQMQTLCKLMDCKFEDIPEQEDT